MCGSGSAEGGGRGADCVQRPAGQPRPLPSSQQSKETPGGGCPHRIVLLYTLLHSQIHLYLAILFNTSQIFYVWWWLSIRYCPSILFSPVD